MIATKSFACEYDGRRHEIRADISHIVADHEIVRRFPEAFAHTPEDDSGGPAVRTYTHEPGCRVTATVEEGRVARRDPGADRRRMAREYAATASRDRAAREWESAAGREDRLFWQGTERLLASLAPPEDRDKDLEDVCDLADWHARQWQDTLDAIDEAHGPFAAWRR
jgi:hypothetical protein